MMMTLITVLKPLVLHCAAQPISVLWPLAWLPADLALLSLGHLRLQLVWWRSQWGLSTLASTRQR